MAKAQYTTADGTKISIEGSPDEVATLIEKLHSSSRKTNRKATDNKSSGKASISNLISDLIDGGFFKKPKELSAVKLTLEEQGHFYPVTTLSPVMLRMVRARKLRRIKDNKRWMYTG